jgi:hypothetical protein
MARRCGSTSIRASLIGIVENLATSTLLSLAAARSI